MDVCELEIAGRNRKYQICLATLTDLTNDFDEAFYRANSSVTNYEQVKVLYPHLHQSNGKDIGRHSSDVLVISITHFKQLPR